MINQQPQQQTAPITTDMEQGEAMDLQPSVVAEPIETVSTEQAIQDANVIIDAQQQAVVPDERTKYPQQLGLLLAYADNHTTVSDTLPSYVAQLSSGDNKAVVANVADKVRLENVEVDKKAAEIAASRGQTQILEQLAIDLQETLSVAKHTNQNVLKNLSVVSDKAVGAAVAGTGVPIDANTVKAVDNAADRLSVSQMLNIKFKDLDDKLGTEGIEKWANIVGSVTQMLGVALTPFADATQRGALNSRLREAAGLTSDNRSAIAPFDIANTVDEIRNILNTPDNAEKQRVFNKITAALDADPLIKTNPLVYKAFLYDIFMNTGAETRFFDNVTVATLPLDALAIGGLIRAGMNSGKFTKVLGDIGNAKAATEATEAAIRAPSGMDTPTAFGVTKGEAISNANSARAANVVGPLVSSAKPEIQANLVNDAAKVYQDITSALHSSGKTEEELKAAVEQARVKYDPSVNPNIVASEVTGTTSRGADVVITWKGGSLEEAQQKATTMREQGRNVEVVKATTSPEVSMTEVDTQKLLNQRANIIKEIDLRKSRLSRGELLEGDVAVKGNDNLEFAYQEADMMFGGDIRVGHILDTIESTSGNESYKALATWLKKNGGSLKNSNIKRLETDDDWASFFKAERGVDINSADDLARQEFDAIKTDLKGAYTYANDTVYIRGSHIKDEGLFLHEVLHAQVSQVVDSVLKPGIRGALDVYGVPYAATAKQEKAARNLQAIYDDLFTQMDKSLNRKAAIEGRGYSLSPKDIEYGFNDVHEMISEALTNPAFQDVLKNMNVSKETQAALGGSKLKNMWDAFVRLFMDTLGLPTNGRSALENIVNEYAKLSKGITSKQRTAMTQAGEYLGDVRFKKEAKSNEAYLKSAYRRLAQIEEQLAYGKLEGSAMSDGYYVREYRTETTALDKIGVFAEKDIKGAYPFKFFNKVIDPHHATSEFAVQQRVVGVYEQAGVQNSLVEYVKPAWNKLSNRQAQRVEEVLKEGDSYSDAAGGVGRDFSAVELKDRFMSIAKNDADMDKMMEAYFRVRGARNIMWDVRNQEMAKSLTAQGYKQFYFKVGDKDEFLTAGKILLNNELDGKTVFNSLEGKSVRLDADKIRDMNAAGQYVVEVKEPYKTADGKGYSRILVSGDNSRLSEINTVLGKRPGEYARIYDDEYFLEATRKGLLNEEEVTETMHFATARTRREAQEYADGFNTILRERKTNPAGVTREFVQKNIGKYEDTEKFFADVVAGKYDEYEAIKWHYDRAADDYVNDYINANASAGRLFVDKRGEKLKAIGGENRDNTLSVLESVQREILNTARVASITEWKDSLIQRWYNQIQEFLPADLKGKDPHTAFFSMSSREYVGTDETQAFARSVQEYVMNQIGAVTGEEKVQRATARAFSEWAEQRVFNIAGNGYGKGIEWVGRKLRNSSPIEFLRTITFHTTLGAFNPAQLLVQAAGATTAVALHPLHGAKAAFAVPLYRMAMMSDNPKVWKALLKGHDLLELGLKSEAEFVETVRALKKSNILSGIRSTSLYNMEEGSYNVFNKGILGAKTAVAEASPFFFNRGEEFARMVAFDVARRLAKEADPAVNILDDAQLIKLVGQADDFTQNMTNANRAAYQSGLLSIPLQFMQYNIKLSVNVATAYASLLTGKPVRGFNATQATKMLAGNAVLYGLAGAGLTEVFDYFFPDNASWSSEQRLYVSEGLVAGFINSLSLALSDKKLELGIGTRLSPFNFFTEWAKALQDKSFLEIAAGPSLSLWQRADKISSVLSVLVSDPNLTSKEVLTGLQYAGLELTSSMSNAAKAYVLKNNDYKLMSKTGKNLARVSEMEMWAQAMGIAPAQVADINRIYTAKKSHTNELNEIVDRIVTLQTLAVKSYNTGDVDSFNRYNLAAKVFWPNNADDLRYVYDKVNQLQGKSFMTEFEKAIYNVYQRPGQDKKPFIVTPNVPEASKGR